MIVVLAALFLASLSILVYTRFYAAGKLGVIFVRGYIISDADLELYLRAADRASRNDSIKAVVIVVDSGGGLAQLCEEVYGSFKRLAERKPTITYIEGLAASGGYMVALAGRRIYASPTSFVGNVGVVALPPPIVLPTEGIVETGPYKYTAFPLRDYPAVVRGVLENFVDIIRESRKDRLNISLEELTLGNLYLARWAVSYGLIDGVKSLAEVLDEAAVSAGLSTYEVVDLTSLALGGSEPTPGMRIWLEDRLLSPVELAAAAYPPLKIYLVPTYLLNTSEYYPGVYGHYAGLPPIQPLNATGRVVVDLTHGNIVPRQLLSTFETLVVEYGGEVLYNEEADLVDVLEQGPKALIVMLPTMNYSWAEVEAIRRYVAEGGKLLLIHDPGLLPSLDINSVAQCFGIAFSLGYLYNSKAGLSYGVYRNIVANVTASSWWIEGNYTVVFFAAASVHCSGCTLLAARTANTTRLAVSDRPDTYAVIAGKKGVLAIGDLSWMLDPYLGVEDNYRLLKGVVKWIVKDL